MIVDCHTHINCPTKQVDFSQFQDACEKVEACIVLSAGSGDSGGNKQISDYVKYNRKMVGFAALNPVEDDIRAKSLASATKEMGLKGVVLYCAEGGFHPAHSRAMQFYESAEELSLPVFFHNSPPFAADAVLDFAQPYLIDEIARRFPLLKIVIGSMGLPFLPQTLCLLAKHENVFADLTINPQKTWEVYNIVMSAHEAGVMNKLLFGSGYPFSMPGQCIETLLGFNKLLADTNLPTVPREQLRGIVERDTLGLLGINLL